MKALIKNQNIKFDTHQAGDGQKINLEALHLEKILHDSKGTKIKFHFFGAIPIDKQNTNVDKNLLRLIQKEVSKEINKNKQKSSELGRLIVNTLYRYKNSGIVEKEALEAAKNIASYFQLNKDFVSKTIKYAKDSNKIEEVITTHIGTETNKKHKIQQTAESIIISSRKKPTNHEGNQNL